MADGKRAHNLSFKGVGPMGWGSSRCSAKSQKCGSESVLEDDCFLRSGVEGVEGTVFAPEALQAREARSFDNTTTTSGSRLETVVMVHHVPSLAGPLAGPSEVVRSGANSYRSEDLVIAPNLASLFSSKFHAHIISCRGINKNTPAVTSKHEYKVIFLTITHLSHDAHHKTMKFCKLHFLMPNVLNL